MKLDREATALAPDGWEIWTTGRKWQAMRKGAKPEDINAWGPMQTLPELALQDAISFAKDRPFTYEFDETGGYDCMYGAFIVKDEKGETAFVIDLQYYGQESCDWSDVESVAKAKAMADRVVTALNGIPAARNPQEGE